MKIIEDTDKQSYVKYKNKYKSYMKNLICRSSISQIYTTIKRKVRSVFSENLAAFY